MTNPIKVYTCPECSNTHDEPIDALSCCNEAGLYYECECGALFDEEQDAIDCCTGDFYD